MNSFTKRLMVIFGEPDSIDPKAYLDEIDSLTSGFGADVLKEAGSDILSTHRYKTWPTPAQCIQACQLVAERQATSKPTKHYYFPSKRGPYDPATVAQWERAQAWRNSLPDTHPLARQGNAHDHRMKPFFKALFEKMQQNSPNQELHRRPLTERSRRMMGELPE